MAYFSVMGVEEFMASDAVAMVTTFRNILSSEKSFLNRCLRGKLSVLPNGQFRLWWRCQQPDPSTAYSLFIPGMLG
jgi:hypothetical protein